MKWTSRLGRTLLNIVYNNFGIYKGTSSSTASIDYERKCCLSPSWDFRWYFIDQHECFVEEKWWDSLKVIHNDVDPDKTLWTMDNMI